MLSEQLSTLMPAKLKTFLAEMDANTLTQTIILANRYVLAHRIEPVAPIANQSNRYKQTNRQEINYEGHPQRYAPIPPRGHNNPHRPYHHRNDDNRASPPFHALSALLLTDTANESPNSNVGRKTDCTPGTHSPNRPVEKIQLNGKEAVCFFFT